MPRNLYGNSLPSVAESRDSDIFYDINTGKSYVFDNGQWNELPQSTPAPAGPTIPEPAAGDAGKVLKVGEDLSYELGEGSDLPEPTIADAGKVLGVDDEGEWALVEGGSGGSNYIIGTATPYPIEITVSDPDYNTETSWAKAVFSSPITNSLDFMNSHIIDIRPAFKNSDDGGVIKDNDGEWMGMIPDFIGTVNEAIANDIFFSTDYLGWVDENNVIHDVTGNEVIVVSISGERGYDISTGYMITNYAHAR